LEPKVSSAWAGLGNCRAGKGDLEGALKAYGESLRILPGSFNTRLNRGTLHLMRKDWASAVIDLDVALTVEPENVTALVRRGEARLQLGEKAGAAADLDKALKIAPANWSGRAATEAMLTKARE
jgi:tetratricopeptide (TPR) repeat protein